MLFLQQQPNYFKKGLVLFLLASSYHQEMLAFRNTFFESENLSDKQQERLQCFVDRIKKQQVNEEILNRDFPRIMIEGFVGKDKYADQIASGINSELVVKVKASELVTNLIGSGPANLDSLMQEVDSYASQGKKVVIFFDGIDDLANNDIHQYMVTLGHLKYHLDKREVDPRYIFVFTANKFMRLPDDLRDRFAPEHIIE